MTEPPKGPTVSIQGGAMQLGMKAAYLANISKTITLTSEDGLIALTLPVAGFEFIQPNDIIFLTLGFVRAGLAGVEQPSAVQSGGGLIKPN